MVLREHFMPVLSSQTLFFGEAALYTTFAMASKLLAQPIISLVEIYHSALLFTSETVEYFQLFTLV